MNNFIMIIDDSPTIRKIIEITLQPEGYHGVSFADGASALTWLDEHPNMQPALVFLDVQMPDLNGYEWASQIKGKPGFHHTAIALMSGEAINNDKSRLAGIVTHIKKPFTAQTILTTARAYLPPNTRMSAKTEGWVYA